MIKFLRFLLSELWLTRREPRFPCTLDGVTYIAQPATNHAPAWVAFKNGHPVAAARAPYGERITRVAASRIMVAGRYGTENRHIKFDRLEPASPLAIAGALPCRATVGQLRKRVCAGPPAMIVDERGYVAECIDCGCATGYGITKAEALGLWNYWVTNPPEAD